MDAPAHHGGLIQAVRLLRVAGDLYWTVLSLGPAGWQYQHERLFRRLFRVKRRCLHHDYPKSGSLTLLGRSAANCPQHY